MVPFLCRLCGRHVVAVAVSLALIICSASLSSYALQIPEQRVVFEKGSYSSDNGDFMLFPRLAGMKYFAVPVGEMTVLDGVTVQAHIEYIPSENGAFLSSLEGHVGRHSELTASGVESDDNTSSQSTLHGSEEHDYSLHQKALLQETLRRQDTHSGDSNALKSPSITSTNTLLSKKTETEKIEDYIPDEGPFFFSLMDGDVWNFVDSARMNQLDYAQAFVCELPTVFRYPLRDAMQWTLNVSLPNVVLGERNFKEQSESLIPVILKCDSSTSTPVAFRVRINYSNPHALGELSVTQYSKFFLSATMLCVWILVLIIWILSLICLDLCSLQALLISIIQLPVTFFRKGHRTNRRADIELQNSSTDKFAERSRIEKHMNSSTVEVVPGGLMGSMGSAGPGGSGGSGGGITNRNGSRITGHNQKKEGRSWYFIPSIMKRKGTVKKQGLVNQNFQPVMIPTDAPQVNDSNLPPDPTVSRTGRQAVKPMGLKYVSWISVALISIMCGLAITRFFVECLLIYQTKSTGETLKIYTIINNILEGSITISLNTLCLWIGFGPSPLSALVCSQETLCLAFVIGVYCCSHLVSSICLESNICFTLSILTKGLDIFSSFLVLVAVEATRNRMGQMSIRSTWRILREQCHSLSQRLLLLHILYIVYISTPFVQSFINLTFFTWRTYWFSLSLYYFIQAGLAVYLIAAFSPFFTLKHYYAKWHQSDEVALR